MTPNFALFLSQDVLRLLMSVEGGWAELGEVATGAPDMAQRLADLREMAQARAPLGMIVKLVIPNDYIRYLTLPPGQTHADVLTALDGATPYPTGDLVVDYETDAGGTQVAAVAREFLDEAEKFAVDHGLGPVSFVANPREGSFEREVFFGPAKGVARIAPHGAALGPEDSPMTIVPLQPQAAARPAEPDAPTRVEFRRRPEQEALAPGAADIPAHDTALFDKLPTPSGPAAQLSTAASKARAEDVTRDLARHLDAAAPAPKAKLAQPSFTSRSKPAQRPAKPQSPPKLPAFGAAQKPVFQHKHPPHATGEQPAPKQPRPALGSAAAYKSPLAKLGGTRFAQIVVAAVCACALLLFGLLIFGQNGETASDAIAAAPEASPTLTASLPPQKPPVSPAQTVAEPVAAPAQITPPPASVLPLSEPDAQRLYAATGVWQKAPIAPTGLRGHQLALATPQETASPSALQKQSILASLTADPRPLEPPAPPPADARFVLDARGFVIPSAEGTRNPMGILVFAGAPDPSPPSRTAPSSEAAATTPAAAASRPTRPAVLPPARPRAAENSGEPSDPAEQVQIGPEGIEIRSGRPPLTPPPRPRTTGASLPPQGPQGPEEAVNLQTAASRPNVLPPNRGSGGVALSALQTSAANSVLRPRRRPADIEPSQDELDSANEPDHASSPYAVTQAIRPSARPGNMARIVSAAARAAPARSQTASRAPAVATAARPSGPTGRTVAARATQEDVIRLGNINLIGVYGSQRNRRALVRLANGQFVKVSVGERLDGGRVTAIGSSNLQYTKNGRRLTLDIPS